MSSASAGTPLPARAYIAVVATAGAAVAIGGIALEYPFQVDLLVVSTLLVAMAASIWSPVRFQRRGGVLALDVSDAVLIALLFAVPLGLVPALAASAVVVGVATRTRDPMKLVFNLGAHALKAAGAAAVFAAIVPSERVLDPVTVVAVFAAIATYVLVDVVLYGSLFTLLEDRTFLAVLGDLVPMMGISAAGNTPVGLLLAFVVMTDRWASAFVFVLVAVAHIGFRGYVLAVEERRRNERLSAVSRELADLAAPGAPAERYLGAIAELFQADGVELVVRRGDTERRTLLRAGEIVPPAEAGSGDGVAAEAIRRGGPLEVRAIDDSGLGRRLRDAGHEHAIAAPLVYDERVIGALVVYDSSGLEGGASDVDLVSSLAYDAAVAAKTLELFDEVRRERALIEGERRKLQDVIDAASDGIVLTDAEGRLLTWNPAMAAIVGHEPADVLRQPWYMALRLRDAQGEEVPVHGDGPIQVALAGDRPSTTLDLQVLRTDGEWRWVRCALSPVVRDGDVAGVVMVVHDVHREREAEELKTDFVATVSHELRTPLTPLRGLLETMMGGEVELTTEQHDRFYGSMFRQVERLENLVSDLLLVADLDRGRFDPALEPCDLTVLAMNAVSAELPPDAGERVTVEDDGPVTARGDDDAITRILRALVNNAVKHTDGRITVRSFREDRWACVSVIDEGGGIHPRDRDRIFEPFSRLGHHLTRATQGPGLGLAIARSLAEQLGGTLTVSTEWGVGATFTLSLPAAGAVAADREGAERTAPARNGATPRLDTPERLN